MTTTRRPRRAVGKNPPTECVVSYWLKEKPAEKQPLTVEFLEGEKVLRTLHQREEESEGGGRRLRGRTDESDDDGDKPIEPKAGLNRLAWDMRILKPALIPKAVVWGTRKGPQVAPGTYSVRLKYAGETLTRAGRGPAATPTCRRPTRI